MKTFMLLNSPIFWDSKAEDEEYLSPLGLGYIATYLDLSGIQVDLVDCVKECLSVETIIERVSLKHPDYVGINVFTQNYDIVRYIVEHIQPKCGIFVGGQAVKSIYQKIIQWNVKVSLYIVIGEGELITPRIANGECVQKPEIQHGLATVYRVGMDSPYFPSDISNIRLNRKYLKREVVMNHYGEKEVGIITSRGCIFDCAFCGGARSLNRDITIRLRTEESVKQEIAEIQNIYPEIESIRVLDDLFLRNSGSIDVANRIFASFPKLRWRGMAHVLPLFSALDRIETLKNGGCSELFVGIESGSIPIRRRIKKLGTSEQILKVAETILKSGIDLKGYFIYGFPKETMEDFQATYELAVQLKMLSLNAPGNFRTSVFQFRPYHGTQLYKEIMDDKGIIHEYRFSENLNLLQKRSQFNFDSGNYSAEADSVLTDYIVRTQRLNGEAHD